MKKVAICVPTRGVVNAWFMLDFAQMLMATMHTAVADGKLEIGLVMAEGTYIHTNREDLVAAALEQKATHILFLDDDMRFPRGLLLHLLSRNKDIVGVNYPTRSVDTKPTAIKKIGDKNHPAERLYGAADATGLEEVEGIGFGAVLIRLGVFERIDRPWFENYYDKKRKRNVGEDIDFCMKAAKAGFTVFVDHDLSHEISHCGSFEYTMEHARARREMVEKLEKVSEE